MSFSSDDFDAPELGDRKALSNQPAFPVQQPHWPSTVPPALMEKIAVDRGLSLPQLLAVSRILDANAGFLDQSYSSAPSDG